MDLSKIENTAVKQTINTIERRMTFQAWFQSAPSILTVKQAASIKSAFLYLLDELLPYDERLARIEKYKRHRAEGRNELNETIENLEIAKEKLNDFIKHWNENLIHQNKNLQSIHAVRTDIEKQIQHYSETETIDEKEMPKDMNPSRDFYLININLIRLYKSMDDEDIKLNTQIKLVLSLYREFEFDDFSLIDDKVAENRLRVQRHSLIK